MPDFALERAQGGLICGIDEVGRGPWAGPVVAAAVLFVGGPDEAVGSMAALLGELDDSKKLAPAKRERLAAALSLAARQGLVRVGLAAASVGEIDRINILRASHLAMARAVGLLGVVPDHALVDGNRVPDLPCAATAVVGGDSLSLSIAAASVIAKVARDRLMARLALRHPAYGWARNKGYGTAEHAAALARHGPSRHHRLSFAPVALRTVP